MSVIAKLFDALYALSRYVNLAAGLVGALCFGAMLLVVLFQVVARYIFASPPFWTEELARWLMIWGGLLGSTVAFHTHADPSLVTPAPDSFARSATRAVVRAIAAGLFFLPVLNYSYPFVIRQMTRLSEGLGVSTAWMTMALPVTCIIVCLHALSGLGLIFSARVRAQEAALQHEAIGTEAA